MLNQILPNFSSVSHLSLSNFLFFWGPSWPWSHGSWIYNYLCNRCLSPLILLVQIPLRERNTTLCDKVCQWLVAGWWFSPGTPVSSTNKTDHHDITEILFESGVKHHKTKSIFFLCHILAWVTSCFFVLHLSLSNFLFFCVIS